MRDMTLVVYNIREFRNDTFIGTCQREMTFIIQTCTEPPPTAVMSAATNGVIVDGTHFQICQNTGAFSFNINPTETDTSYNIKVDASGIPAGATFTVTNDSTHHPIGLFSWTSTAVTPGSYTFYVTFKDNACAIAGVNTVAYIVTINPPPTSITGTLNVCVGATTALASTPTGGTWTSTSIGIATIGSSSGVASGIAAGTSVITYSYSPANCTTTAVLTVNPLPGSISGPTAFCIGGTGSYTDPSSPGGTWTSSLPGIATIGSSSGIANGLSAGVTNIIYTLPTGCSIPMPVTVNIAPGLITGTLNACVGATSALGNTVFGGTWTSASTGIATIGSSSGIVTGVAAGTSVISYSMGTGCAVGAIFTVNITPVAIAPPGPVTICLGTTSPLSDGTSGGTWSSSSSGIASVGSTGIVTGAGLGTATISYTIGTCYAVKPVTVINTPSAIAPSTTTVCAGSTTNLTNLTSGGTWTSGNTGVAAIGSISGTVTGVSAGIAPITYTVGSCQVFATVSVFPTPSAISPAGAIVCTGTSTSLTDPTIGGVWSSGATGIATVGTSGSVTGMSVGTATISYTVSGCSATAQVTVVATPTAISPASSNVCAGNNVALTDVSPGGTWTSSNPLIATAGSSTGTVTGVAAGAVTITYTTGTCFVIATVTVNANPSAITPPGAVSVCVGGTTGLADVTPGGTWSSGATGIATAGTSGIVTGVSSGTVTISYTTATGCSALKTVTVSITPVAITPISTCVCIAGTNTLTDGVGGGVWTSSNRLIATVGSSSGTVTGVVSGSVTITYSIGSCITTSTVTVAPAASPGTISGPTSVCVASTITLIDGAGGGVWSSSSTSIATVGTGTGVVTGVGAGVATISYSVTNPCGTVSATYTVNVLAPGVLPISGLSTICAGTFTNYTDGTSGGAWTASNSHGTISSTGLFTGISTGIDTIKYQVTNACGTSSTTKIITIGAYLTAGTITGPSVLCEGTTMTDADLAPGGVWSSSNTGIASVGTGSGFVTGIAGGPDTILYTVTSSCGSAVATHPITVNPLPNAGAIIGSAIMCAGMSSPYSDAAPGGVWSMTNGLATAGSATGLVTAIIPGIDTVVYTVTNSCGTARAIKPITLGAFLTAGTISGASSECAGSTITLTDPTTGGIWSVSNGSATVAGGVITGVAGGVDTILYTVTSACGSVSATHPVTVNPLPDAGSIVGPSGICTGTITLYTDASPGGVWNMSNAHATITGGGSVTAVSAGTDTIGFTVTNVCGTASTTMVITTGTISSAGTISGPGNVCIGSAITLTDGASGGSWSSSNTAVATVGSSTGLVTGISSGNATISYTLSGSCGSALATAVVTVSPVAIASAISGPSTMCTGTFTLFTDASPGGVWSSSNSSVTVSSGGLVTAVTAGTDTVGYTVATGCGTASATKVITILPGTGAGSIIGPGSVCTGFTIILTNGISGGVWSSSNSHATVSTGGVVTGITAGTDTIMYTVVTSCGTAVATHVVVVTAPGDAGTITGPSTLCAGSLVTMTDGVPGGAWSSSNPHATITTAGVVTGITPGVDTISYTIVGACGIASTTKVITVNLLPSISPISGPASICAGVATLLTDATLGGVWSSSNTHATIGSSTGVVTGVTPGIDTIIYFITSGCGTVATTAAILVSPLPDAGVISGPDSVCSGSSITLSDPAPGGIWSAGNVNATVSSGVVTGISAGTDPISYSVTNSCGTATAVQVVSVVTFPTSGLIIGGSIVCAGSGITLTDAIPGGSWAVSNGNAVVAGPGIIEGVTVGVDTVFYVVTNFCGTSTTSKILNVYPVPVVTPITGTASECAGTTSALADAVPGGVWTSSTPAVATIGISSGIVTGIAIGTTTITYTVTNGFGCPTSVTVTNTVNAMPVLPAITGSTNACIGATTALSNTVAGGTWSSSNTTIATVDAFSGVVTGVSTGSVIITYTVVNPCGTSFVVHAEAVNPMPVVAAITGINHQCEGATSTLSDATTGGVWISSNTAIATVGSSSGIVAGVAAGTTTINYIYTSGFGCSVTTSAPDTVVASPVVAAITGTMNECVGATTTLSDATAGGAWSSGSTSIATVSSGVVTGVATGIVNINYSLTNGVGCTTTVSAMDTVKDVPVVAAISGATNVCVGATTTLSDATGGGVWGASNAHATVAGGLVTGVTSGTDTISYTVTNACGSATASGTLSVNPLPDAGTITGSTNLCTGSSITLGETVMGGVWSASNGNATVSGSSVVTGVTTGLDTISYTVTNTCGTAFTTTVISIGTVLPNAGVITGPSSVCKTASITLIDTASGGVWSSCNAHATVAGGVVTGVTTGFDTIRYTVSNVCGSTSAVKVITIIQAPSAGTITGASSLCPGQTINLSESGTPGGTWSSNNTGVATVSAGIVAGVSAGSATISYTVANSCGSRTATHGVTVLTQAECNTQVGTVPGTDPYELTVYPNPNKGTFTLNLASDKDEHVRVVISNIIGQKVKEFTIATNKSVSVTIDKAAGFYLLSVYTSKGKYVTKVTVE